MDGLLITHDQLTLGRVLIHDQHGIRCMRVAVALAAGLGIHEPDTVEELERGSWLHDIGKSWVPEWVLLKAGKLEPAEYIQMQQHSVYGAAYLRRIGVNGGVWDIVQHHHEKWNGEGYPDGLSGTSIPMLARIIAPIDTYDALRSHRNYPRYDAKGKPLIHSGEFTHDEAMAIIEGGAGTSFDPRVVKAFLKLKDKEFR